MKNLFSTSAVLLSLLGAAGSAKAQIITSVEFASSLSSSAVAGEDAVSHWNAATLTGTPGTNSGTAVTNSNSSSLLTSTGTTSSVNYSIVSYGNKNATETFASPDPNPANDSTIMSNGAATRGIGSSAASAPNPVSLTLSGLNHLDTYEFIVYVGTQGSLLGAYSLGLNNGGATYYALTSYGGYDAASLTTFVNHSTTTDFEPTMDSSTLTADYQSNYVEFTGYSGFSSATLTLTMIGGYQGSPTYSAAGPGNPGVTVDISGVQVIDLGAAIVAAPEPSTYALLVSGFLSLLVLRKRRS